MNISVSAIKAQFTSQKRSSVTLTDQLSHSVKVFNSQMRRVLFYNYNRSSNLTLP